MSLPKESSSPEPDSFDRIHAFPKAGGGGKIPHPRNIIRWMKLVSPFVVAFVPSTTCSTQTSLPLPCSRLARSPGSYSDHTPTLRRLNHLADYCQAPVTKPAALVLPRLIMAFTQSVTSLVGFPTGLLALCPNVPARHSFHEGLALAISGDRRQKHPLTRKQEVFAVRHRLRLS